MCTIGLAVSRARGVFQQMSEAVGRQKMMPCGRYLHALTPVSTVRFVGPRTTDESAFRVEEISHIRHTLDRDSEQKTHRSPHSAPPEPDGTSRRAWRRRLRRASVGGEKVKTLLSVVSLAVYSIYFIRRAETKRSSTQYGRWPLLLPAARWGRCSLLIYCRFPLSTTLRAQRKRLTRRRLDGLTDRVQYSSRG